MPIASTPSGSDYMVSVVVPVFNEEDCLPVLASRLVAVLSELGCRFECLFVDDGSVDKTATILAQLNATDSRLKGLRLSRNFGHQAALTCGLDHAQGDVVITMDADFQHPPECLPLMLYHWYDQGAEIVNMVREAESGAGFWDSLGSRCFYRLFNAVADIHLTPRSADFRLLDRRCVQALAAMNERFKFFRGQVSYIGFKQLSLPFSCPPRLAGLRSYTIRQSIRLAANGLSAFSTIGLKFPLLLGLGLLVLLALLALIPAGWSLAMRLPEGPLLLGLLGLSISLQLMCLGMMGVYIGKILGEVKGRPLYFVAERFPATAESKQSRPVVVEHGYSAR